VFAQPDGHLLQLADIIQSGYPIIVSFDCAKESSTFDAATARWRHVCARCGLSWTSADKEAVRNCPVLIEAHFPAGLAHVTVTPPDDGPGTEYATIVHLLGFVEECSACQGLRNEMNVLGASGCRRHRDILVQRLKQNAEKKATAWSKVRAAIAAATHGMTFINPRDPVGSIFDEAVRRAQQKADPRADGAGPPTSHTG
jgi:hypothetical protein